MQSRTLHTANKFEKEIELAKRRGKDMAKLRAIIERICGSCLSGALWRLGPTERQNYPSILPLEPCPLPLAP